MLVLREQRICGHDQVHADRLHLAHRAQRPLQLRLERPLIIDFLAEVASGPVWLIEQLKSHTSAARQRLRRDLKTSGIEFVGGNQNAAAIGTDFERYLLSL